MTVDWGISAFDLKGSQVPWCKVVPKLIAAGYDCRESHHHLFVWEEGQSSQSYDGVALIAGLLLRKWASPNRGTTRVVVSARFEPKELYESAEEQARAKDAVEKATRNRLAKEVLKSRNFIEKMVAANRDCLRLKPVKVGQLESDARVCIARSEEECPVESFGWNLLRKSGSRTPATTRFSVVSESYRQDRLERFVAQLKESMIEVGFDPNFRVAEFSAALDWLRNNPTRAAKIERVFLIGVMGAKGDSVPSRTMELVGLCDQYRIPYRIFSKQSLTNRYALNDQAPHLLRLAGERVSRMNLGSQWSGTIFLGFDLGHPKDSRSSVIVMTIVGPEGELLGYWRSNQERDETIRGQLMEEAIEFYRRLLNELALRPKKVVVLRDGRMFKHDGLSRFADLVQDSVSILEIVKQPVPCFWAGDKDAEPGSFWVLEERRDALLQTTKAITKTQSAKPLRIRIVRERFGHPFEDYLALVYNLCHAPSLGLRATRIPAPVYWSDGLARNGGKDLQFRGIHNVPHLDHLN